MAKIVNSKITPLVNVEARYPVQLENFRKLRKGVKKINVPDLIIDMAHLKNLIDTNPGYTGVQLFLTLDDTQTVGVHFQPIMLDATGTGPGSGQGVKVP